ncbi:MAG: hypothetical protein AAF171_23190 [Cyanobacteria bacterium P01_A01_bin.116]
MIRHQKLLLRLALFAGLIIPLILRQISGGLEPFPSVLQPLGDDKVSVAEGVVDFSSTELVAVKQDGSEERIEPALFFDEIPTHYWTKIVNNGFGIGEPETYSFSLGIWTVSAATTLEASEAQKKETLTWINDRLSALDIQDVSHLSVRTISSLFDIETQTKIKNDITDEISIEIAQ